MIDLEKAFREIQEIIEAKARQGGKVNTQQAYSLQHLVLDLRRTARATLTPRQKTLIDRIMAYYYPPTPPNEHRCTEKGT